MSDDKKKPRKRVKKTKPAEEEMVTMTSPGGTTYEVPASEAQKMLDAANAANAAEKASKPRVGHVSSVDIQHALRASLLLDTESGGSTSTYSSLEVGISLHIEGIPPEADYKQVVAEFSEDAMAMVAARVKLDARALGFRAFTDMDDQEVYEGDEATEVSDGEL